MRVKTLFKKTHLSGKENITLLQVEGCHLEEALPLAAINTWEEPYFPLVLERISIPRAHPTRHMDECFEKCFFLDYIETISNHSKSYNCSFTWEVAPFPK